MLRAIARGALTVPDLRTDAIATRTLLLGTISRALVPQAPREVSASHGLGDDAGDLDDGDSPGASQSPAPTTLADFARSNVINNESDRASPCAVDTTRDPVAGSACALVS